MKIELNDVTNIDSVNTINSNFDKIVNELQDKVLYRDNPVGEPNTLESNLDMNGFDIINVKDVYSANGRWATIEEMLSLNAQALTYKNQALQYSLDSLNYKNEVSDIAIEVQGYQLDTAYTYQLFNKKFLGVKGSDPATDNQGNTLVAGTMYFRTTAPSLMRIYNGSVWQDVGSIITTTTNTVDPVLFASTLEAQQGTSTAKVMSPARVKDAIDSQVKSGFTSTGIISSTEDAVLPDDLPNLQQVQSLIDSLVPPGAVLPFAMATAPTGWIPCDGRSLSRAAYPRLFSAIGTLYGAVDVNTFNVPDYRGEFLRGWDNGRGIDPGRAFPSFQGQMLESHNHPIWGDVRQNFNGSGRLPTAEGAGLESWVYTEYTGGSETRPRNWPVLYCIKT